MQTEASKNLGDIRSKVNFLNGTIPAFMTFISFIRIFRTVDIKSFRREIETERERERDK